MVYEDVLKNKEKSKILAGIVAHLMGDGCVTNKYFMYSNKNPLLLENYEKNFLLIFP